MTDPLDAFDATEGALVFWLPADDTPADETFLLWGPVAPGSSADTRLRVRNESDDYLADDVIVAAVAPVDTDTADGSGQLLLSADGDTFTPTLAVGDLPPNSVSAPFWLRRITAPDTAAGPAGFLLTATAGSWAPAAAVAASATSSYDPAAVGDGPEDAGAITVGDPTPVDATGTFDPSTPPVTVPPAVPVTPVDADEDWTPP